MNREVEDDEPAASDDAELAVEDGARESKGRSNHKLKQRIQIKSLIAFYEGDPLYYNIVCDIIEQKHRISLRALHFLCSKMARENSIFYAHDGKLLSVAGEYDNSLGTYGKHWFDAFKRSERVEFDLHNRPLVSTVGQLTYFRTLQQNRIIDYAIKHINQIEDEMGRDLRDARQRARTHKKRKRGVSPKPRKKPQGMHIHKTKITVKFF